MPNIYKVVLTGGPCGGKTTLLSLASTKFKQQGLNVLVVPEAASIIFNSSIRFPDLNKEQVELIQDTIFQLQTTLENQIYKYAQTLSSDSLILIDRGVFDNKAFIDPIMWNSLLDRWNVTENELLDRYDSVIHLVTAANGAPKYYTTDNNPSRTETPEQACLVDFKLIHSWSSHKNHHVLHNDSHFEIKSKRALHIIAELTKSSLPLSNPIVTQIDEPSEHLYKSHEIEITVISKESNLEKYTIKRQSNQTTYTLRSILKYQDKPVEKERYLQVREYYEITNSRDHTLPNIHAIVYPSELNNQPIEYIFIPSQNKWYIRSWTKESIELTGTELLLSRI